MSLVKIFFAEVISFILKERLGVLRTLSFFFFVIGHTNCVETACHMLGLHDRRNCGVMISCKLHDGVVRGSDTTSFIRRYMTPL